MHATQKQHLKMRYYPKMNIRKFHSSHSLLDRSDGDGSTSFPFISFERSLGRLLRKFGSFRRLKTFLENLVSPLIGFLQAECQLAPITTHLTQQLKCKWFKDNKNEKKKVNHLWSPDPLNTPFLQHHLQPTDQATTTPTVLMILNFSKILSKEGLLRGCLCQHFVTRVRYSLSQFFGIAGLSPRVTSTGTEKSLTSE
eukprot:TRINITY_DN4868_c0_g2_i12.p1 TRINITY_DN4868_c0_g2~~TRINITY_DN4868_c0_g2_i12.p1  ORF type:complete len:197 (+),score=26.87 TRINITY_DN4868_c0_g2_i12:209-799(+)